MVGVGLGGEYLAVVSTLGRLVPGWVEGYVGGAAQANAIDAGEEVSVDRLLKRVEELEQKVSTDDGAPDRRIWLLAQLSAISTALQWLEGERVGYRELFERCHGSRVELVCDQRFEQAHALLDRALPGHGDTAARYREWRDGQLVPRERLQEALTVLAGEMRRRCHEMFDLPEAEGVTWELVSDEPWAGHADYKGQLRTLVKINAELPISSPRLLELVCHEAYPGHHTEHVCKDVSLIVRAGREELAAYVYPTPQALISEGLASYALEALLAEDGEEIAADCLGSIGIPYDHETATVVREAEELLLPVRSNIALMLDDGATSSQARDYARAWLLEEATQIDEAVGHLETRSWRPYESCYPVGLHLCRKYAAGHPKRFRDLLYRQLTPGDLASGKAT